MSRWGIIVVRIMDALEQLGPMTSAELARELAIDRDTVGSVLSRLKRPSKRPVGPKRVHVVDWCDEDEGSRTYLRAIYAAGNKVDATKPPRKSNAERSQRYRDNKRQQSINLFGVTL